MQIKLPHIVSVYTGDTAKGTFETTEKHGHLVRMIKPRNFGSAILHGRLFKRQERKACTVSSLIHFFGGFCAKNQLSAREVWKKTYFMVKYRRISRQKRAAKPYFIGFRGLYRLRPYRKLIFCTKKAIFSHTLE
jgi:hypothetical protein